MKKRALFYDPNTGLVVARLDYDDEVSTPEPPAGQAMLSLDRPTLEDILEDGAEPLPDYKFVVDGKPLTEAELGADQVNMLLKERAREQRATELAMTDGDIPRPLEDLIDTLVAKGVLSLADLPQKVQEKLERKKALRAEYLALL